jgi:hypothetical protein
MSSIHLLIVSVAVTRCSSLQSVKLMGGTNHWQGNAQ